MRHPGRMTVPTYVQNHARLEAFNVTAASEFNARSDRTAPKSHFRPLRS